MKYIVDTDYSSNSQIAIEILLKKNLNIIAFTTVFGFEGQHPSDIKSKMEADLKKIGKNIPVYVGAQEPYIDFVVQLGDSKLLNPYNLNKVEYEIPQTSGIKEVDLDQNAALKLIDLVNEHKKDLTIISLSALTNISLACLLDNSIHTKFDKLIICGGNHSGKGNSGVFSEANFRADPAASKNVIHYYSNITLFPLEIDIEVSNRIKNEEIELFEYSSYIKEIRENKGSLMQLLLAYFILNQDVLEKMEKFPADVDITGKYTRGCISMEKYSYLHSGKFNFINFVESVKLDKFVACLKK